ncbi:MAG: hypothetical protein ABIW84_10775, partial [Ilumatobacteraceae bacterium]
MDGLELPVASVVRQIIGPSPDPTMHVKRVDADHFNWYQAAGLGRWWNIWFLRPSPAGLPGSKPNQPLRMYNKSLDLPYLTLDDTDGSFVYGGTWLASLTQSGTFGGTWRTTSVVGSTVTWTSPACQLVILRTVTDVNVGLAKVTIDGSATAANGLPTAAAVVASGAYPSTILVANGGTLNPTDRVFDGWSSVRKSDVFTLFADGMTSGAHTVVMTFTGYANVSGTGTLRMGVSGFSYSDATMNPATPGVTMYVGGLSGIYNPIGTYAHIGSSTNGGADEISFQTQPAGGGTFTWAGGSHGYESETSSSLTVDGVLTTLTTDGQIVSGATVIFNRVCDLFHPNLGAGNTRYASDEMVYTFTANGLHFAHT